MEPVQCVFRLRNAGAAAVSVVGTFNDWSTTATPMINTGEDRWEAAVALPPGHYPYCYFVLEDVRAMGNAAGKWLRTQIEKSGSVLSVPFENVVRDEVN